MYTVYMHTLPDGKKYVGMTSKKPESRWNKGKGYISQIRFTAALSEFDWDNIKHQILAVCDTEEEAMNLETKYIAIHRTNESEFGYNCPNDFIRRTKLRDVDPLLHEFVRKHDPNTLGGRIHQKRKLIELTQAELAQEVGVSRRNVMAWEYNHHKPNRENMNNLCRVLGVTVKELEKGE